jgi:hypothetical protein
MVNQDTALVTDVTSARSLFCYNHVYATNYGLLATR